MSYPKTYSAIKAMIPEIALETKMARSIARKGGLRQRAGEAVGSTERTLLDCWVDPKTPRESRQWRVDLTGFRDIRYVSRGPLNPSSLFLVYSETGFDSTALNPGDWERFPTLFPDDPYGYPTEWLESYSGTSELEDIDDGYGWARIPEAQRRPLRLSLSQGTGSGTPWTWDTTSTGWGTDNYPLGFSVGVQVR